MRPTAARALVAIILTLGFAARNAHALVTLNDGTDKIFVSAGFSTGWDSNISASAANTSDFTYSSSMSIEYQRRAGLITVNGNVGFSLNDFVQNPSYNTLNPAYSLELDKGSGRLTGAFTLNAQRSSQADAAVNLYDTSWNYNFGLNLHYPVIERYSLSASLNYGLLDYTNTGGQPLVNLSTYSASLSLFYILSEQRDLFATYRYRYQQSSSDTATTDNGISLGVNGRIIWEINGSISGGYEQRSPTGILASGNVGSATFSDVWGAGQVNWSANKRLSFTSSISRDYSTTALDATTLTTSGTLDGTYAFNARISANAGVAGGINRFFGTAGLLPGTDIERQDYYFTWHAGVSYSFNGHLNTSLNYSYFQNWSNLSFASFSREGVTLGVSTHW